MSTPISIAKKLNESVGSVIGNDSVQGFERAFLIANAIHDLKTMLTSEYMKPIMAMQGNRLGFKTDKDKTGGYPEDTVKNCLIEAVLIGVQPFGNQFNIIAANCYITKEGYGHLLGKFKGLKYTITLSLPKINAEKTGAAVTAKIEYDISGEHTNKDVEIPIKMDAYTTVDAIIGKATRKSRAWLFNSISDIEVADGDVQDIPHEVIESKQKPMLEAESSKAEHERISVFIEKANCKIDIEALRDFCKTDELKNLLAIKEKSLSK